MKWWWTYLTPANDVWSRLWPRAPLEGSKAWWALAPLPHSSRGFGGISCTCSLCTGSMNKQYNYFKVQSMALFLVLNPNAWTPTKHHKGMCHWFYKCLVWWLTRTRLVAAFFMARWRSFVVEFSSGIVFDHFRELFGCVQEISSHPRIRFDRFLWSTVR